MTASEAKKWLKSIIKQRMHIVSYHRGHVNEKLMLSICERLTNQLCAFPYSGDKIFGFINRHYTDILLIIPGNKSEHKNLLILNELCLQNTAENQSITTQKRETQLYMQSATLQQQS